MEYVIKKQKLSKLNITQLNKIIKKEFMEIKYIYYYVMELIFL